MLSNKETAREVEGMMQQCSAILTESVRRVMETCPQDEIKAFRTIIGKIMGAIYFDVKRPIHLRYPDLEPDELKRK